MSQKTRILFYGQEPYKPDKGGIGSYINHRAFLLSQNGFEVWWSNDYEYCRFDEVNLIWQTPVAIVKLSKILSFLGSFYFNYSSCWKSALNNIQPDIIEFPDGHTSLLPKKTNIRFVLQCHTSINLRFFLNREKLSILRKLRATINLYRQNIVLKQVDSILACSNEIANLEGGFHHIHPDYVTILYHYFSKVAEPIVFNKNNDIDPFFLVVGNFEYFKGFDLVLRAYETYKHSGGLNKLIFAGNKGWSDGQFQKEWGGNKDVIRIKNSIIANSIEFVGTISKDELSHYRKNATAVIIASRFEAFTMVAGECLLSNTPMIISDRTGWTRIIERFNCARLVSPYNLNDFSNAMFDMENKSFRETLKTNALRAMEYITGEDLKNDTINYYKNIINS